MNNMQVRKVQERRRSSAAGLHKDKRTKRQRTRQSSRRAAIQEAS